MSAAPRVVHEADALAWLAANEIGDGCAFATSLPDVSEFRHRDLGRWRTFFVDAAALVLQKTPRRSAAIFFQTDVKHGGAWLDKAFLVQLAAERTGTALLWHKFVCRARPGTATFARPGHAHLLCFSHELRDDPRRAVPDVLPELGEMPWPRAIGVAAARFSVRWLREHAAAHTIVDPFCGVGTLLAAANELGLAAVGVERHAGRAEQARSFLLPRPPGAT